MQLYKYFDHSETKKNHCFTIYDLILINGCRYLEENPQHWYPNHNVVVKEIENVNKIKIALYTNHTMNFQDWAEKNRRRTKLVMELKRIFEELKINYNLLPQTVHLFPVEGH